MVICWDCKADRVAKGDDLREITPIYKRTYEDNEEVTPIMGKKAGKFVEGNFSLKNIVKN